MSRRPPNPSAERAAQNQQTLKTLVKIESNKSCADCKRNKQPRWASWNLGVFVCIRCSGIHRGMGTHISRVKSVDLDAWTDEQVQNMLRWGNARANKYWEAKLAADHIPQEAKIENFIRTKYDSKRWVMDGPMPDPATLDVDGDDETPLTVVQEKAKIERSASMRAAAAANQPPRTTKPAPEADLLGGSFISQPPQPQKTSSIGSSPTPPPKTNISPPKQKQGESLLGFDFFGPAQTAPPARPASASAGISSNAPSRPDLKQSILSLYSSAPKNNPPAPAAAAGPPQSFGSLNDDFSSLNFGSPPPPAPSSIPPASKPAMNLFDTVASPPTTSGNTTASPPPVPANKPTSRPVSGGGFFDPKPVPKPGPSTHYPTSMPVSKPLSSPQHTSNPSGGWGDFSHASPISPKPPQQSSSSNPLGDLFDFSATSTSPAPAPAPAKNTTQAPLQNFMDSPFNLSSPTGVSAPKPSSKSAAVAPTNGPPTMPNLEAWGSNDAWADASSGPTANPPPVKAPATIGTTTLPSNDWGWGNESIGTSNVNKGPPQVTADEDFGGWEAASPVTPKPPPVTGNQPTSSAPKPLGGGFGTSEDLYSNVWE